MSNLWDEICKYRASDLGAIPVVIAGNKHDLPNQKVKPSGSKKSSSRHLQITDATAEAWLQSRMSDAPSSSHPLMCFVPLSVDDNRGAMAQSLGDVERFRYLQASSPSSARSSS